MTEFFIMFGSWFWLGILIVSCVIEAFTMGFTTIWSAIASIPLIFIARTSLSFKWQILIFVVLTVILVVFTRPFAVKKLKIGRSRTNVDSIVGEEVLIVKAIEKFQKGEAKANNGVIWTAKSVDGAQIPKDSVCEIVSVEGNTLCVKEKSQTE